MPTTQIPLYRPAAFERSRRNRKTVTNQAIWQATRVFGRLQAWRQRRRQRNALMRLSDTMLRDIGITSADAAREFRKPFWRD